MKLNEDESTHEHHVVKLAVYYASLLQVVEGSGLVLDSEDHGVGV